MAYQQYRLIAREETESIQNFSFRTWRIIEEVASLNGSIWDKQIPQKIVVPREQANNSVLVRKLRHMVKDPMACIYGVLLIVHKLPYQVYYCWDYDRKYAAFFCPTPLVWNRPSQKQYWRIVRNIHEDSWIFAFRIWRIISNMAEQNSLTWKKDLPLITLTEQNHICHAFFCTQLRQMIEDESAAVYVAPFHGLDSPIYMYYCWDEPRTQAAFYAPAPLFIPDAKYIEGG